MEIIRAGIEDLDGIYSLYTGESNSEMGNEPVKYRRSDFRDYLNDTRTFVLCSKSCGEVNGFLLAYDLINWCYLDVLIVHKDHRGKGIASTMLEHLSRSSRRWESIEACYYSGEIYDRIFFKKVGFVENVRDTRWVGKKIG